MNRKTFIEWDKEILGSISDIIGLQQGGCSSDRFYRLVNNEQVKIAQDSRLGVELDLAIRPVTRGVVSAVAHADDVALVSMLLRSLQALLQLTKLYCTKFQVKPYSSRRQIGAFLNSPHFRFLGA